MNAEAPDAGPEEAALPRTSLAAIAVQCEHALTDRIAKRYSTRDALKALEKRCKALLDQPEEDHAWQAEFEKVITTANAVFDQLIAEVEPAGHA
jgi:hypothetical protein